MSVATKVVLQMNCKMGGELWAVRIPVASSSSRSALSVFVVFLSLLLQLDIYFYRATVCNATYGTAKAFSYVCLSNACIVTERKELVPTFLYRTKEHLS